METFFDGDSINLTATPATGYTYGPWSGGGCSGSAATPCVVSMTEARSVTANFTVLAEYTLDITLTNGSTSGNVSSSPAGVDCGNGTSVCQGTYYDGTAVTLSAIPATGYVHGSWSGGGCSGSTASNCNVTVDYAKTVEAEFILAPVQYQLQVDIPNIHIGALGAVSSSTGGIVCTTGTVGTCSADIDNGTIVTLTATPNTIALPYSKFVSWSGDCSGTVAEVAVTMSSAKSCTAEFDLNI